LKRLDNDSDAEAALIERRWFATVRAVRRMQAECEVLREVMELAEASWRRALRAAGSAQVRGLGTHRSQWFLQGTRM